MRRLRRDAACKVIGGSECDFRSRGELTQTVGTSHYRTHRFLARFQLSGLRWGFKESAQHFRAVYWLESGNLRFFAGVDSDGVRSSPVGIVRSKKGRFFSAGIVAASGYTRTVCGFSLRFDFLQGFESMLFADTFSPCCTSERYALKSQATHDV